MGKNKKKLPTSYRPCVGVMLFNGEGKVWIGRRKAVENDAEGSGFWWQMPQGGIDKNEDAEAAALRELYEETGAVSASVIEEAPRRYRYDLPDHLIGIAWKGKYRGQEQRWFALRFTGSDDEFDLSGLGHKAEFDDWRWASMSELVELIVPFKREVYNQLVSDFAHLAGGK